MARHTVRLPGKRVAPSTLRPQGLHLIHSFVQLFRQPLWGSRLQETKVDAEQSLAPWRSAPDAFSLRT